MEGKETTSCRPLLIPLSGIEFLAVSLRRRLRTVEVVAALGDGLFVLSGFSPGNSIHIGGPSIGAHAPQFVTQYYTK